MLSRKDISVKLNLNYSKVINSFKELKDSPTSILNTYISHEYFDADLIIPLSLNSVLILTPAKISSTTIVITSAINVIPFVLLKIFFLNLFIIKILSFIN